MLELDPSKIRDIAPLVLDEHGRMRVLPAEFWAGTTLEERALFGHLHAVYSFPTVELVEYLREAIAGRSAIEIGAGHGVLAEALGIPATDSLQQNNPQYRGIYKVTGQPTISYGSNVVACDADMAIRRFRPEVVIGCWVTHKYDSRRHWAGGNEAGVDEADVIARVQDYIMVGNEVVHAKKAIWDLPHVKKTPPWLYSRATNENPNFLATWRNPHYKVAA